MPNCQAKEARAFGSPGKYIQGPGEFDNLYRWVKIYGDCAMAVLDPFFYQDYSKRLIEQFESQGMHIYCTEFHGQTNTAELDRLAAIVETYQVRPSAYIGMGGGKSCDMAKALAGRLGGAMIVVPTAISTDAPTTTHSVFYNDEGMPYSLIHTKNPEFVIVDTDITVNSPVHMFVSGMGDALATYIEGRAAYAHNNVNNICGGMYRSTLAGRAIAKLAFDTLMEKGRDAYYAAKNHIRTAAYEDVAEANTLLSGVGFENTAASISHGIEMMLHSLDTIPLMHGTGVGYGVLIQLLTENTPPAEFEKVYSLCYDVGLPVCMEDLGIRENKSENARKLAEKTASGTWVSHNVPFYVDADILYNAILYLDAYTEEYKRKRGCK